MLAIMMGQDAGHKELFSYAVDMDRRVPADHPLRRVGQMVDFTFAREFVAHTYGANGNMSVNPVILLKLDIGSDPYKGGLNNISRRCQDGWHAFCTRKA